MAEPSRPAPRAKKKESLIYFGSFDVILLLCILFLIAFGLLMAYSTSFKTSELQDQLKFYIIGFVLMLGVAFFPRKWFPVVSLLAYIASMTMLILVVFTPAGITHNGETRWLKIFGQEFQPSEVSKMALIMFLAVVIAANYQKLEEYKTTLLLLLVIGVPALLIARSNLSTGIIVAVLGVMMLFMVTKDWKRFVLLIAAVVFLAFLAIHFRYTLLNWGILKAHHVTRLDIWLGVTVDADTDRQVVQGLYAIGSGGFFGKGLGAGTQKLGALSEAGNDMIFAIICEELGFFGALLLIILYVLLLFRMNSCSQYTSKPMDYMLIVGVMLHVALQVVLHIAVVCGVIPNTGVTLPFISSGGSSAVLIMMEMGLVLNVSRDAYPPAGLTPKVKGTRTRVRRTYDEDEEEDEYDEDE